MPTRRSNGRTAPRKSAGTDMPSTLERSPAGARETYTKAHDSAVESYGEGERAHRTAFAALKHSYEKVGDRWKKKLQRGPSDRQAARSTPRSADRNRQDTEGGVNAKASKDHLMDVARQLEVKGRSQMTKQQLVDAIEKANARSTRQARARS